MFDGRVGVSFSKLRDTFPIVSVINDGNIHKYSV